MRAIAIGLVLLYHVHVPFAGGGFIGVDVFFVISGFLITGVLMRDLETHGRISLARFYARRAKRLLPAAGVVLVATAALTAWSTSVVSWRVFGQDIAGAAGYVVNWLLADRAVDYLAEDVAASPVQHFWSLAIEEQFYLVWPLLLTAIGLLARRRRGAAPSRRVLAAAVIAIIIPSLVWSIMHTAADPARAFFVTTTRAWELALGALVAIGVSRWQRIPPRWACAIGWLGLCAVVGAGVLVTQETHWPGYAALVPTVGTAAVIIGGCVPSDHGPSALLSLRPLTWLGALSYSLYLWHWPLLIAATSRWGELSVSATTGVVAASIVAAVLSHRFLESPIRFAPALARSNTLALSVGLNFSLLGLVAGLALVLAA
ncbi:acyltransferase family protein [Pseudactinotalea sp. HY160]|uniref:acyltransferase family protein n=1 Tax=Pseudactinotalea sp. HY160 TaxID=2654490 RepID=UPI00128D13DD|nr:acyltransferase family protein [Pseudactinotalea sp. HY160]